QPLRRVSPPAIGVRQSLDKLRGRRAREGTVRVALCRVVHAAVDRAVPGRRFQLTRGNLIPEVLGNGDPVFDDASVHVSDIQRAVRSVREKDRSKPLIGGGEELTSLVRLARSKSRAVV